MRKRNGKRKIQQEVGKKIHKKILQNHRGMLTIVMPLTIGVLPLCAKHLPMNSIDSSLSRGNTPLTIPIAACLAFLSILDCDLERATGCGGLGSGLDVFVF